MNTMSIKRRVDELERGSGHNGFVVVCLLEGESREEAIERTLADGGFRKRDRADLQMIVLNERDSRL